MTKKGTQVLILMGSASDTDTMMKCKKTLADFGVASEITVASAHRSPARAMKLAAEAEKRGVKIIVAGAGLAAHLAGVVAAHTRLPVIGVPMAGGSFNGMDALLSTVQMPPGVPVATVAVGDVGAKNAAFLALRILALSDKALAKKLEAHAAAMAQEVEKAAAKVEESGRS